MGLNERIKPNQLAPTAPAAITGAAPQTVDGAKVTMNAVERQTLSARVTALVTTSSLTLTAKWQVSDDGSTFIDCAAAPNNPANVAFATGTGVGVTTKINVPAPAGVYGVRYARLVLTSGVGVGGGSGVDEATVGYNWTQPSGF